MDGPLNKLGMTHQQIAEKARTSRVFVTQILNGSRHMSVDMAYKFGNAFGLDVHELLQHYGNISTRRLVTHLESSSEVITA